MNILIFGASGRTGHQLAVRAIAAGHTVHAAGRDPSRLAALAGVAGTSVVDLFDSDGVADLMRRVMPDVVVSSIGGGPSDARLVDEIGNNAISDAAAGCGVARLIQISSLACGDSRPYASDRIIAAIGPVLEAKTRAEDHLRRMELGWTIVRPGGLTDGPSTGGGALYDDPRVHGRIARADLAAAVLRCIAVPATARRILSCVDRATLPPEPDDVREFVVSEAA